MKKKVIVFAVIVAVLVGLMTTIIVVANSSKDEPEETPTTATIAPSKEVAFINKDAELSDIKKVDGVVNVYMFWGSGCPHCKAQWEWLESIREEYTGKIAVYGFEVFNNRDNRKLMDKFAAAAGDGEVDAVPYTIVGNQRFNSYSSGTTGKMILEAVEKARKSGSDIYFDKKIK